MVEPIHHAYNLNHHHMLLYTYITIQHQFHLNTPFAKTKHIKKNHNETWTNDNIKENQQILQKLHGQNLAKTISIIMSSKPNIKQNHFAKKCQNLNRKPKTKTQSCWQKNVKFWKNTKNIYILNITHSFT
jgi:uncharacterized protein YifE (UPF0438 family)